VEERGAVEKLSFTEGGDEAAREMNLNVTM
jgi:hypothetical protein